MFSPDQIAKLSAKLDPDDIKTRKGPGGKKLAYIEGEHVVQTANEIFGFGGWSAETTEMRPIHDPVHIPPTEENPRGGTVVTYAAKCRLTVYAPDGNRTVVRERWGAHRGFGPTVGEAVENCIKSAETDALKRALVTFGNPFGLPLRARDGGGDKIGKQLVRVRDADVPLTPIDEGFTDDRWHEQEAPRTNSERALGKPANSNGNGNGKPPVKATVRY